MLLRSHPSFDFLDEVLIRKFGIGQGPGRSHSFKSCSIAIKSCLQFRIMRSRVGQIIIQAWISGQFFSRALLRRETISSRLFDVTRQGDVVWDCTLTAKGKVIDGVYQATRYSASYLHPLLETLEKLERDETRKLKSVPYVR